MVHVGHVIIIVVIIIIVVVVIKYDAMLFMDLFLNIPHAFPCDNRGNGANEEKMVTFTFESRVLISYSQAIN